MNILGIRMQELRKEKNLSQGELAEKSGTKQSNVSKYESGDLEPSLENLIRIADIFGVSLDYLAGRTNDRLLHQLYKVEDKYECSPEEYQFLGVILGVLYKFFEGKDPIQAIDILRGLAAKEELPDGLKTVLSGLTVMIIDDYQKKFKEIEKEMEKK